jgi:predicted esterase
VVHRATTGRAAVSFLAAMIERHLTVSRTARLQLVGTPQDSVRELWLACHGYGQLAADFARQLAPAAAPERVIVVPEALSRFYLDALDAGVQARRVGATWMTREDREAEIGDYVAYLDAAFASIRAELPSSGVTAHALGFSQGVATVVRWVALGETRVDALTLWAGGLPHDLALEDYALRFDRTAVTLVAGDRDKLVSEEAVATASDRLHAAGIAHEVVRFAGGHRLDAAVLRRLTERA